MRNTSRTFLIVAAASLMTTISYFLLAFALSALLQRPSVPKTVQGAGVVVTVLLPICTAGRWVFRRLRADSTRREARAAAIAFGFFAPAPLALGLLVGPIVGGYTGLLLRTESRLVAFSGALIGVILMVTLVTFVTSLIAAWTARHIGSAEQMR